MSTTAPSKEESKRPLTPAERKALIFRRRKESAFWAIVAMLGSLKFAVILLVTIAIAISVATIVESRFDTPVAQHYIYKAPWFLAWLFLLCINLAAAALSRWPWQKKHTGFVITHAGIILLLIGSVVGMLWGFEAYVTLRTDGPARDRLHAGESVLKIQSARDGGIDQMDFPVEAYLPTEQDPATFPLPETDLQLVVTGYSESLRREPKLVASLDPAAPPGFRLWMKSNMMGQELQLPFLVTPEVNALPLFTMAEIEVYPELPPVENIGQPVPVDFANLKREDSFRETHVVMAKHPRQPIIASDLDQVTGYRFELRPNKKDKHGQQLVMIAPNQTEQSWLLEEVLKKATLTANNSLQVVVPEYWPDFDISSGTPASKSEEPNNPAVRIDLYGALSNQEPPKPTLQLAPTPGEEALTYRLLRNNEVVQEGNLPVGESLLPGWADWALTLSEFQPHAAMTVALRESAMAVNPSEGGNTPRAMRGIRAHLIAPDGRVGESQWMEAGITRSLFLEAQQVRLWFGPHIVPLDFDVKLESFAVPRDEGTDNPADFISKLAFTDKVTGEVHRDEAHMNTPAMYPGGFWRAVMGWNYKFSQAGWNRNDLNESSLQVLYDPGWSLKWIGSLLICVGIFMLFYMKGYGREPGNPKEAAPSSSKS